MEEMVKYLKALTSLQLQAVTGGAAYAKPEWLLERAGFTHKEIAQMLGKTQHAVSKSISRAKLSARGESE
jgi:DNA-directed RNA polymerase specialized sigma24 family protein